MSIEVCTLNDRISRAGFPGQDFAFHRETAEQSSQDTEHTRSVNQRLNPQYKRIAENGFCAKRSALAGNSECSVLVSVAKRLAERQVVGFLNGSLNPL